MDNHPIPQDVTHFQFKLIGELTIKQFAYVAAGGILAWISISLPINFLIKLLFAILFGGSGAIFAFIPIEGRTADLMLSYLIKAVLKPNQYVFHKQGAIDFTDMHYAILPSTPIQTVTTAPASSMVAKSTMPLPMQQQQSPYMQPQPLPKIQPIASHIEPKPAQPLAPLPPAPVQPQPQPQPQPQEVKQINPMEEQLRNALSQKQQLEQQLVVLQQQIDQKQQAIPQVQVPVAAAAPSIKKTAPQPYSSQMPMLSDFPNIVIGVVKDSRGNVLPNILVEVKDADNNPVRAFKTNALGQFASATSLLNGTYSMIFEDPAKKHKFETIQIAPNGEIMQPIEVISIDDREELRKELFG